MTRVHLTLPLCAIIATLFAATTARSQTTGYWKYVKTDSGVYNGSSGTLHDNATGGETALTLTDTAAGSAAVFAVTLYWNTPPTVLIPGTYVDWRVSGKVAQNSSPAAVIYPTSDSINMATSLCGNNPGPTDYGCGSGAGPGGVVFYQGPAGVSWNDPVGTVRTSSNLQQPTHTNGDSSLYPPQATPGYTSTGLLTWQVYGQVRRMWIWHYQYQWVAGSLGSCAGTCALSPAGQTISVNGGPGSVSVSATSTWDVVAPDSWIQITSPTNGNGNSTVTFTVKPNTGPARIGTIIIGNQPYSISQDGTSSPATQTGLDLHRPKLVVTDTGGNTFTLQPAPGKNDGTDDGSANAGKDTGVFGQSSGGWPDHNFGKDSPVYVMTSTCNNSTGYAYLQFSLAGLPTQNVASAKVQVYAGSTVVSNLSPVSTDPIFAARRVTSSWNKSTMTWNSGQPTYDSTVVDSQTLSGAGGNKNALYAWLSYDVTNLYKGWASGSTPNYGLRFSHENGQCLNGWLGTFATSNDQPAAQTGAPCTFSLSLSAASVPAATSGGAFTMNASAATCGWTAKADATWIHVTNGTSGTGSGAVSYTVDGNTGSSRSGTITLTGGGQSMTFTVAQAGASSGACTPSLSASSASPGAAQTTGTVTVTVGTGCTWTAASNATWITITSGASGTSNGTVTYTVAANTGIARTGTLTIAGLTFTVSQASGASSGCSYNVSPTDIHATAAGLSNTVLIFTNSGCNWMASVPSGVAWITLNPTSGSGGGAVGYSIAANTGAARSTTITVAGTAVTVEQDASSSCTYTLSSTSSPLIPGVGGVGSVAVTVAGTSCTAWKAGTPPVNWVHVAGGSGSISSGTVSYSVDSNTATAKRSTTLTIANQSYTVQQDVAPCTYALGSAGSGTLAAGGASASFHVTVTGPACTWSVTLPTDANSQWIHVISALSAMSSSDVSYTVDPNNATSARSLALTVNGKNPDTTLTYTVSQAAGAANTAPGPIVDPNGIVNSASFISASLPAGSIAQGSFFSIFGNNLGPANPGMKATSYPLGTNLGGVSVKVTQGSTSVDAIPLFVAQYQINAVMPSNTPTGTVQVTVSYNGLTSAPAPVQVVVANFGSYTVSGGRGPGIVQNFVSGTQTPLNMTSVTAAPGDTVILWGTGLGPLPGGASDTLPAAGGSLPASVQVLLGNVTISPAYAGRAPGLSGVDQIDFQLPSTVTLGCYVPLQVVVNGNASNTVTMAINNNRQPCSDASPFSAPSRSGGKNASIALARLSYTEPASASKIGNGTVDVAMGTFNQSSGTGDLGFSLFASLPPINTCTYYNNVGSLNGLLGGQVPSSANAATPLDAGPTITVKGPNGTQGVAYADSSAQVSPYLGVLGTGGGWTALGLGPGTPFLDTGTYTVTGPGGKDVGPFQYTMQIPSGATWANRDSITAVDRSKGLTIQWSGGNSSTQLVAIIGFSSNPATNVSGGFACLSDMAPQSFTVPANFLANLPATPASGNAMSALVFLTVPTPDQFVKFSTSATPSLDSGLGYYAVGELRNNVVFQ